MKGARAGLSTALFRTIQFTRRSRLPGQIALGATDLDYTEKPDGNRAALLRKPSMNTTHSDAGLVFFWGHGRFGLQEGFPFAAGDGEAGRLDVPVIGVAKAGWNLDQLRARAHDSVEKHGGLDPGSLREALGYAALRRRRLQRPGDISERCGRS